MSLPVVKALAIAAAVGSLALAGCANNASGSGAAGAGRSGAAGATPGVAAGTGTPDLTIMIGGMSKQIYLPYMLAQQLGYYDKAGVSVRLIDEPAGGDATANMLAGQVQGVGGFYDHTIVLQGKGKAAESVISMLQNPGEVELCRTDLKGQIKSPADWKGRSLGITDTGSSTDFLTQYIATKAGVNPSTTTRRGVGAGQTFLAALHQKAIDCGMTTEPTVSQALASGEAYILLDMRNSAGAKAVLGGEYPATSLYMPTDYVNSHKDVVQKLVNAYVATLAWIQNHNGAQIADKMPASYYAGVGKDAYAQALNNEKAIFNPTGIMPPSGPATCLAVLSAFNPAVQGKKIDTSATFTNEFVTAAKPLT
jgi:NitT/TauT family transport system substrate-binding protein